MIRDANETDFERIVDLNAGSSHLTSVMDRARLARLDRESAYHRVTCVGDNVAGFLLVFDQNADYDSVNYRWFVERYPHFLYIDRIVVDQSYRGAGLGSALYRDLFDFARDAGVPRITCEYNRVPLNAVSREFHRSFGFSEVGTQWLEGGKKQVSHQVVEVTAEKP